VVAQIVALHREAGVPLRTIHMGGDELANGAWEQSPASLARMRKEKLAPPPTCGTTSMTASTASCAGTACRPPAGKSWPRARRLAGRNKLIPNPRFTQRGFTAWVWNNTRGAEDLANRLANGGYDIVLAPVSAMYLDMAANPNPEEPGVNWNDYVELDRSTTSSPSTC
jgi:hexosaminidase